MPIQAALVLCWAFLERETKKEMFGEYKHHSCWVRRAASTCSFRAKAVIVGTGLWSETTAGSWRELVVFGKWHSPVWVLLLVLCWVFKGFVGGNQRQMRFVSSEQFFVSVFWSFSVSHKVKLEQTQIYRKTCYYRVLFFFCSKHLRRKGSIFSPTGRYIK